MRERLPYALTSLRPATARNRRAAAQQLVVGAARGQRKLHFLETARMARQRSPRRYHSNMVVRRRNQSGHATTPGPHTPRHDDAETHKNKKITDHAHRPATVVQANPGIGTGQGPSLEWGGSDTTTGGAKKLSEALEEADIERKKAVEEAERRAKWQEQEREEKLRKVAFMKEMPDDTPAGSVSDYMYKEGVKDQLDKSDLGVPRCCGAFTPSTRVVSRRGGRGWFLFRF